MYFVFPVCAFAVVVQLIITTAIAAKTDFNTDFFIFTLCFKCLCLFFLVFRYSFIVYRYANVYLILILQKKNEKKISKNDKNISFFVLCRMEVYEETDFMQEVTGIGELILPIAFAFTGRGDFVCPNTWNELFSSRQN